VGPRAHPCASPAGRTKCTEIAKLESRGHPKEKENRCSSLQTLADVGKRKDLVAEKAKRKSGEVL